MTPISDERLTFTEAGPHGECVISPENGTGPYFTLIGGGSDEEQNALAAKICDAVNGLRAQGGLPGEAEVVVWRHEWGAIYYVGDGSSPKDVDFTDPGWRGFVTLASYQSLQARVEAAEDKAGGLKLQWQDEVKRTTEILSWYKREKARADAVEMERDEASREIRSLLTSFVREHFRENENWRPLDDLVGMITQMDNACTVAREYLSRAEAAEARVKELEEALGRIVSTAKRVDLHNNGALWDLITPHEIDAARTALKGGSNG